MSENNCDVLIIGSGLAALQTAIYASRTKKVILITKTTMRSSNTYLAQGGVAAAHAPHDHAELHYKDTMEAGEEHNNSNAVSHLVSSAVPIINELIANGLRFDRDEYNRLIYGLEGAHSERRILHCNGDATGKELAEFLISQLQQTACTIREKEMAIELLVTDEGRCIGALTKSDDYQVHTYYASHIVLATGGCGWLYPYTTNSVNATGDGFALALKAGARLKDMEFIQFHPTGLFVNGEVKGLISEAVRGEGAILVDQEGKAIMQNVHPLQDLAPRHIVAQTIFSYLQKNQSIWLDISMILNFDKRFPAITALCEKNGVNWKAGKIPVAPASHFMMGGIETDEFGCTNVSGLYAAGEVACTGIHGANRLASNSLLEGLVYGKELGIMLQHTPVQPIQKRNEKLLNSCLQPILPSIQALQQQMLRGAGIVRSEKSLFELLQWLNQFSVESILNENIQTLKRSEITQAFMLLTAISIVNSALLRKESRGAHNRSDYDQKEREWQNASIIVSQSNLKGSVVNEQVKA